MTTHDYDIIAAAIKQIAKERPQDIAGIAATADALAADFVHYNPLFNRTRFMHDCGFPLLG